MFTGIVEEIGTLRTLKRGARSFMLEVSADRVLEGTRVGDSIATNGVCLTVTRMGGDWFAADVMPETVERTALGRLQPGDGVNLERALTLGSRLGGHLVAGHVDATGRIIGRREDDTALWLTVAAPKQVLRYVVEKGSVAIDGVSLTVARVDERSFCVSLIPHTQGATTLHRRKVGDEVNLENDMIVKYVEKLMGRTAGSGLTVDFLRENGF